MKTSVWLDISFMIPSSGSFWTLLSVLNITAIFAQCVPIKTAQDLFRQLGGERVQDIVHIVSVGLDSQAHK
jgi:hypothetical protein